MRKRSLCLRCWAQLRPEDRMCPDCGKAVIRTVADRFELSHCLKLANEQAAFLAQDRTTRRDVFVRVAKPDARKEITDALAREARTIRDLIGAPGIPSFIDAGKIRQTGGLYTVQEYVYGVPLAKALRKKSATDRVEILSNTFAPVIALSSVGLIHCALSLDHFVLTGDGGIVLLDYRQVRKNGERSGGTGVLGFAAPEQWNPMRTVTPATDVFGQGACLYRNLTEHWPYGRGAHDAHGVRPELPKRPSHVCARITAEMDDVILRALNYDPEGRYASPQEFYHALTTSFGADTVPDAFDCAFPSRIQRAATALGKLTFCVARGTVIGLWFAARGLWWSARTTTRLALARPRVALACAAAVVVLPMVMSRVLLPPLPPQDKNVSVERPTPPIALSGPRTTPPQPAPTSTLQFLTWPAAKVYQDGGLLAEAPSPEVYRIRSGEQKFVLVSNQGETRPFTIKTQPGRSYVLEYNFDTHDLNVKENAS